MCYVLKTTSSLVSCAGIVVSVAGGEGAADTTREVVSYVRLVVSVLATREVVSYSGLMVEVVGGKEGSTATYSGTIKSTDPASKCQRWIHRVNGITKI